MQIMELEILCENIPFFSRKKFHVGWGGGGVKCSSFLPQNGIAFYPPPVPPTPKNGITFWGKM